VVEGHALPVSADSIRGASEVERRQLLGHDVLLLLKI
jgi:hypothetical protein